MYVTTNITVFDISVALRPMYAYASNVAVAYSMYTCSRFFNTDISSPSLVSFFLLDAVDMSSHAMRTTYRKHPVQFVVAYKSFV